MAPPSPLVGNHISPGMPPRTLVIRCAPQGRRDRFGTSRLAVSLLAAMLALEPVARAATIDMVKGTDGSSTIVLSGEIISGDDERFATVAGGAP